MVRARPFRSPGAFFGCLLGVEILVAPGDDWEFASPGLAFTVAAGIGILGTGYFLVSGRKFEAYT